MAEVSHKGWGSEGYMLASGSCLILWSWHTVHELAPLHTPAATNSRSPMPFPFTDQMPLDSSARVHLSLGIVVATAQK